MPIKVICVCGKKFSVEDELAGKWVKCPACQKVLNLSQAEAEKASPDDQRDFAESANNDSGNGQDQALEQFVEMMSSGADAARRKKKAVPEPVSLIFKKKRLVFSMVLCGCLLPLTMWGMATLWNAAKSSAWPSVEGTLTRFEVVRSGKTSQVELRYRYHVGNSDYSNDRIDLVGSVPGLCPRDIWAGFSPNAKVRVYYDPRSPDSSALVTGVPTALRFIILPMFLMGAGIVLFGWSSSVALFGAARILPNPDLEDPRTIARRAGIAICGTLIVYVGGGLTVKMVTLLSTAPDLSRDTLLMVSVTFLGLAVTLFPLVATWFGGLVVLSAFKRPETLNDLRNASDAPSFSESSLICFLASLGSSSAIIVDHERGQIHFRKTHQERGQFWAKFFCLSQKWFSCPLNEVTQAKRQTQTVKGTQYESLHIETSHGQAVVSSTMPNYVALCHHFEAGE